MIATAPWRRTEPGLQVLSGFFTEEIYRRKQREQRVNIGKPTALVFVNASDL
jgi:hypothetical protein